MSTPIAMIVRQAIPHTRPALGFEQQRWLFAAALRSPAVFQAVRDRLPPNTLCMPGESGMELLWKLAVDLVGRFSLDLQNGDSFRDTLKAHFLSAVKADADLTPVEGVADIVEVFLPWAFSTDSAVAQRSPANLVTTHRVLVRNFSTG